VRWSKARLPTGPRERTGAEIRADGSRREERTPDGRQGPVTRETIEGTPPPALEKWEKRPSKSLCRQKTPNQPGAKPPLSASKKGIKGQKGRTGTTQCSLPRKARRITFPGSFNNGTKAKPDQDSTASKNSSASKSSAASETDQDRRHAQQENHRHGKSNTRRKEELESSNI